MAKVVKSVEAKDCWSCGGKQSMSIHVVSVGVDYWECRKCGATLQEGVPIRPKPSVRLPAKTKH